MIRPIKWTCGLSGHEHGSEHEARVCEMRHKVSAPYGWCPVSGCDARGLQRERRPNGNDKCERGHTYPSAIAVHVSQPKNDRSEPCQDKPNPTSR